MKIDLNVETRDFDFESIEKILKILIKIHNPQQSDETLENLVSLISSASFSNDEDDLNFASKIIKKSYKKLQKYHNNKY